MLDAEKQETVAKSSTFALYVPQRAFRLLEIKVENNFMIYKEQIQYIRSLASQVAEIVQSDDMEHKRELWHDAVLCKRKTRPPVYCNPNAASREILPARDLKCEDPDLRFLEFDLRFTLFKLGLGDDRPISPYYKVEKVFEPENEDVFGVPLQIEKPDEADGAWKYINPIKTEDDLDKLEMPTFKYNEKKSERRYNWHLEILGDILPVKMSGEPPLDSKIGKYLNRLLGCNQMMLKMALNPNFIHRITRFVTDSILKTIYEAEEAGILTENNDHPKHYSESIKEDPKDPKVYLSDLWHWSNSQEYDQVSPEMWREFCLNYQKEIFRKYKYISYGCCEDLTQKIDDVLEIPNLKIFVNGPWTDLEKTVEKVQDKYFIEWRQNASDVIYVSDKNRIEEQLGKGLEKLEGCHKAIVLQELATIKKDPQLLYDWVELAKQMSQKYS